MVLFLMILKKEDDIIIENNGAFILIDMLSYQYLVGAELDYNENINGSYFIVRNPNAKTTCGCGSSFSILNKYSIPYF